MFNKNTTNKRPPGTDTIVGQASRFEGKLHCETDLHIEGKIVGDITCTRDVMIGDTGSVSSNIQAANLIVAGELNGNVNVSGSCVIEPTGRLNGDVVSATFIIKEGGTFNGTSHMDKKHASGGQSKPEPAASTSV
ncbi:bactofilin family protein [Paenibacillus marinisediminis]